MCEIKYFAHVLCRNDNQMVIGVIARWTRQKYTKLTERVYTTGNWTSEPTWNPKKIPKVKVTGRRVQYQTNKRKVKIN